MWVYVAQASTSVRHLVLPSHWSQRNAMVPDLVKCYGACGRTIIFCETKRDANDLTTALAEVVGTRALHGDIPQVWNHMHMALRSLNTAWLCSCPALHPESRCCFTLIFASEPFRHLLELAAIMH